MYYKEADPDCTFYGYLKADGAHVDQGKGDGGGSNGIGKMASFNYSKISTVLVSSHSIEDEQKIFQGATILCTHYANNKSGEKTLYYGGGFYDCNEGEAVTNESVIPQSFIRTKYGTDIIIVGVDDDEGAIIKAYDEIKKNVLLNFWPAIDEGTLIVQIGETIINASNLETSIRESFCETIETDIHYKNPLPYYLAVKGSQQGNEDCKKYGDNDEELGLAKHPTLGHVQLFIMKNKGSKDRIIATRKPLMVIQPINKRSSYGYSAVVFCDDENGNKYLSNAEGPAHNKWDVTGMEDDDSYTEQDCHNSKKAIDELSNYIQSCVLNFFASDIDKELDIEGLSDLLSSYGKNASKSGAMTTNVKSILKAKNKISVKPIDHTSENSGRLTDDEENTELFGGDNNTGDENDPNYKKKQLILDDKDKDKDREKDNDKDKEQKSNKTSEANNNAIEGDEINTKELINCDPIPMSIKRDGRIICRLKFKLPKEIKRGSVEIYVATADGKLKKSGNDTANIQRIEWAEVNGKPAEIDNNKIVDVSLAEGDNIVDFRFPTNNRYRLIIEIYSHKI